MKIKILATGSSGNASIIKGKKESIGVDFGLSFKKWDTLRTKESQDVPTHIFITHSHSDHFNSSGLSRMLKVHPDIIVHTNRGNFETDEFLITAFLIPHNVENHGLIIREKATNKKLVWITDCSNMYDTMTSSKNIDMCSNADYYALEGNFDNRWMKHPEYLEQMGYRYNVFGNMARHTSKQEAIKTYAKLKKDTSQLIFLHQSSRFFNFA